LIFACNLKTKRELAFFFENIEIIVWFSSKMAKRKGKGKEGLGKDIGDKKQTLSLTISSHYEGALDSQYYVIGLMRNGLKAKARIIECRESKCKDFCT